jgi:hypothetical protein
MSGHSSLPRIGEKARKPLAGLEPLQWREKRKPYFEGWSTVRVRWVLTLVSGVVLAVGGLLWSQMGLQ